jgi:hypothetical protein
VKPGYGRGVFYRIRAGWSVTKKAWGVIRSHPGLAKLPLTSGAIAPVAFLVFGIPGAGLLNSGNTGAIIAGAVLLVIAVYLASFAAIYFNVALAAGADQVLHGEQPDVGAARDVARSRIRTIAGWPLVSSSCRWCSERCATGAASSARLRRRSVVRSGHL